MSPPGWRREALRTTLWVIPTALVLLAVVLFAITNTLDHRAANGDLSLPTWVNTGGPDAARTILTAIAASIITVVGVVFSVTIVALTLASTQFGPRMLRNFIRDFGTQFTLGTFVATFVFCVLALASVTSEPGNEFVPHVSVTVALGLTLIDLGVLIYFIHHVTKLIQVTDLIRSIAGDLGRSIDQVAIDASAAAAGPSLERGLSLPELLIRLDEVGLEVPAQSSGYLQAVGHRRLVKIATRWNAVVRMVHRPGHFLVQGRPLAIVWPAEAAPDVARELGRAHVVGPHRTLFQDLQFGIDQMVEISIRALSPAVNDTFTALTCIDWIGDALCKLLSSGLPNGVHRDSHGNIRLIEIAHDLRPPDLSGLRQDPSGRAGHACGRHPPARDPDEDRRLRVHRRPTPGHRARGRHDPALGRRCDSRGERQGRCATSPRRGRSHDPTKGPPGPHEPRRAVTVVTIRATARSFVASKVSPGRGRWRTGCG